MNHRPPLVEGYDAWRLVQLAIRTWGRLNRKAQPSDKDALVKRLLARAKEEIAEFLVEFFNQVWANFDISDLSDEEVIMLHGACERAAKAFVDERSELCLGGDAAKDPDDDDPEFN